MDFNCRLVVPRERKGVPIVRHICGDALRALGLAESWVADVELAVTEACTNVLLHSHSGVTGYEVELVLSGDSCVVRVIDSGGFELEGFTTARASLSAEGGRGLHLMRSVVDGVTFLGGRQGTTVQIEKRLQEDQLQRLQLVTDGGPQEATGLAGP